MLPAHRSSAGSTPEKQRPGPRAAAEMGAGTAAFDDDATFDRPSRQPATRWLGPLLGGLFATALVILTLVTAVVLGGQEGMLVAGVGPERATATPSAVPPSATPAPSATPSPSPTIPSPSPTASPANTPAVSCPAPAGWRLHAVQAGETLAQIAARYGTSESLLQQVNCLQSTVLYQGQPIYVPGSPTSIPTATRRPCAVRTDWHIYTVKAGDTLSSIARRVNISVETLKLANCLTSDKIYVGQRLRVPYIPGPTRTPVPTTTPAPSVSPTDTPTGGPPTDTPTGEPPTETPTGEPPTDTPSPPTDTPAPPPTDTPAPPPTDTPLPPTDTPLPPPTDTPGPSPEPTFKAPAP